jgi:ribosomal protein S30
MPSHGALSKAGKVRSINGSKKDNSKLKFNPKVKNRSKYNNRVILDRNAHQGTQGGQYRPGQRKYRRKRRR